MKPLLILSTLAISLTAIAQDTVSIYFGFNSSIVTDFESEKLVNVNGPNTKGIIEISAHCDTMGTTVYNQKLAQLRLNTVLGLLKLDPQKKTLNGEEQASNSTNYNAVTSRRVDVIFNANETNDLDTDPVLKTKGAIVLSNNFNSFVSSSAKEKTMDLSLLFIPGYAVLIRDSHPEIQELFELLKDNPSIDAVIHGHVCCADDYKLSYDRALMVFQYLTKRGIDKKRLTYMGHSNRVPRVSPEKNESDRLLNRRVTVDFIKK